MNYYNAVKTFLHLAEAGSFTSTAKELAIKTSTVSRHIADLEKDLGIALFNRTTRGVKLTEGGEVFYQNIYPALNMIENAREAASALNKQPSGVLKLCISPGLCRAFFTPHMNDFSLSYPNIKLINNIVSSPPNLIEAGYDLSIQHGHLPDSSSKARQILPHWYMACVAPEIAEEISDKLTVENLACHNVMTSLPELTSTWFAFKQDEVTPCKVNSSIAFNDEIALLDAVLNHVGIGLIPYWLAEPLVEKGQLLHLLENIRFSPTPKIASVWAVYSHKKTVSTKVRAFIDFILEKIK